MQYNINFPSPTNIGMDQTRKIKFLDRKFLNVKC